MRKVLEGAEAVAEAVKLANPKVIPVYPITPQTHIVETIAKMLADGEFNAELVRVESEHSAISVCVGAQATGVRSYTATCSQGLALMHEILFIASGMRLPIVMSVANRALSAPLNIWNDQQDSFSQRDSGWLQLYVEDAQEAFDTHLQAFKIAEGVRTPVMVCLDGFFVSHTYEPVKLAKKEDVKRFLPEYKPKVTLNPSKPVSMGSWAGPAHYIKFKKQQQDAIEKSAEVIKRVNREFNSAFGRMYGNGLVEAVNMEGKEHALITIGSVAGTARTLLEKENMGMIRVRSLRPFPAEDLRKLCKDLKSVGILEKDISLGVNGALYDEVRSALYSLKNRPTTRGFIAGLGGRDITPGELKEMFDEIKAGKEGVKWVI